MSGRREFLSNKKSTWRPVGNIFFSVLYLEIIASFLRVIDVNMHLLALKILPKASDEAHIK